MLLEQNQTAMPISSASSEPLTETDAAARLGLKVATLRAWRIQGKGPAFLRLGRAIRYLTSDVDEFLSSNRHSPTSHAGK
jgi:predicted DNA-binding transcriptional regulator AlpA